MIRAHHARPPVGGRRRRSPVEPDAGSDQLGIVCPSCDAATPADARFCPQCGSRLERGDGKRAVAEAPLLVATGTERRQLTAVFCDLVGSSELATKMDPEDFAILIGRFHRCVRDMMERYGGLFARPMGDGALIFFGYPAANEDDAERAIRASLNTVKAVSAIDGENGRPLHVKIGIATGIAIVGDVAEAGTLDAAGEALNLAARLQELAEPDSVVIAETVKRLLGPLFVYRDLGLRTVKGWKDPVMVAQVLRPAANSSRFELRACSRLTPLIGRDVEIEKLHHLWERAHGGAGRVALLVGEAGIGKSRLAAQLTVETGPDGYTLVQWFAAAHQQGVPLYPWIQLIERTAGLKDDDSPEVRRGKLEAVFDDAPEEDVVLIAGLVMAKVDERSPVLQYAPQRRRSQTLLALINWLVRICRRNPVLAVFDDAHWCDPTTAEFLGMVVRRTPSLPLLLVITARPEFRPDWIDSESVEQIPVRPLRPGESTELIRAMAGANAPVQGVIDTIVDRCDGVPLFLEEVTKGVLESIVAAQGRPVAAVARNDVPAVPQTIHASLLARLDRLGPARSVAEMAAAIGREFSVELLQRVHDNRHVSLRAAIRRLLDAGVILPSGRASEWYRFKHSLIQDTAYGIMVRDRRRSIHRGIALALEMHFPQTAAAEPQQLARHCAEGGLIEKAIGWWLRAGVQSLQRAATSEASAHIHRALQLCATLPDTETQRRLELELRIALGKIIIATQGHAAPSAKEAFARARALCVGHEASPQLLTILFGQWTHALLRAEFAAARQQAEELFANARKLRNRVWKLIACYTNGFTDFALGSFGSANRFLSCGIELFDPDRRDEYARPVVGDPRVVLRTYFAWERMCVGHIAEAWSACDAAVTEARALGQFYSLAHALSKQAYLQLYVGTPANALAAAEELQVLSDQHGIAFFQAAATFFRGWCCSELGHPLEGLPLVQKAAEQYRGTGTLLHIPSFLRVEAELLGRAGQPASGLDRIAEARTMLRELGERWEEAEIRRTEGELFADLGRVDAAEAAFREADRIAKAQGAHLFALRARTSLAELLLRQDRRGEASAALGPEISSWQAACEIPDLMHARTVLTQLV